MLNFKLYRWSKAWFGYKSYVKRNKDGSKSYALTNSNTLDREFLNLGFKREY